MKRYLLVLISILTASGLSAQSRYLPLGINGSSLTVSTQFDGNSFRNVFFEAGYGIGGRMDLSLEGGVLFETINGSDEVIPSFSFNYDIIMLKQKKAVPFSLQAGLGIGFASALTDDESISGSIFGFNMLLTHDFFLKRFRFGLNGIFEYNRMSYDVTDLTAGTTTTYPLHQYYFGAGVDIGYNYYRNNQIIVRVDVLWDRSMQIWARINLFLVIPSLI